MQELIEQFVKSGLTNEQAQASITTISQWLEQYYPVAGAVIGSWIKTTPQPNE